jgi:hypothetical protein
MTNEELLALAVKADLCDEYGTVNYEYGYTDEILAYGKLVADKKVEGMVMMTPDEFKIVWDKAQAEEREACAKFIEQDYERQFDEPWRENLAKAIRARGEA